MKTFSPSGQSSPLPSPIRPEYRRRKRLAATEFRGSWLLLWTCLLLAGGAAGCRVVQRAADLPGDAVRVVLPGDKENQAAKIVELQHNLLRFSDEFVASVLVAINSLDRGTNASSRELTLRWKTSFCDSAWGIATGPSAFANLLDMVTMVTLARMTLQDYWLPQVFGESARPLLEACQSSEDDIWAVAGKVLTPAQLEELRAAIKDYHATKPDPETVLFVRAYAFEDRLGRKGKPKETERESVFSLLMLDPLAGLSPATRELAQTRLFGERTMFLAQRMPRVLRWQTELLALNTAKLPAVQQLLTNSTQLTAAVERFTATADKLPAQISAERKQILEALPSHEDKLATLAEECRETFVAGSQLSTSLNTAITTFDALMKRFGVGETNGAGQPKTNAEPFRIQDFTATAAQLEGTARQLTELLVTFDQTAGSTNLTQLPAHAGSVLQQAQAGGKDLVDYALWRIILLVAVVLAAALVYRFLAIRMSSTRSQSS